LRSRRVRPVDGAGPPGACPGQRAAAGDSVTGIAEAAGRVLAKLRQSLPTAARAEAAALASTTLRLPRSGDEVDHTVLLTVSTACRTPERIEMRYRSGVGEVTERRVEPYRVVNVDRRWYLVARDLDAGRGARSASTA